MAHTALASRCLEASTELRRSVVWTRSARASVDGMADEEKGIDALHAQWTAEDGPLRQLAQDVWALHHRRAMFNGLVGMLEGQGNPHRAYVEGFLAGAAEFVRTQEIPEL